MQRILIVPGLDNSGEGHWQGWFESVLPNCVRVQQRDWSDPDLGQWSWTVAEKIRRAPGPVWIVAHSFGCLAAAHAGTMAGGRISGAFLAAPADPDKFGLAGVMTPTSLPFPTMLVASQNDPWMELETASHWARRWGAIIVDAGRAGHINVQSGHGAWPAGLRLFRSLQRWAVHQTSSLALTSTAQDGAFPWSHKAGIGISIADFLP